MLQRFFIKLAIGLPAVLFAPWAASFTYDADSRSAQAVLAVKEAVDAKQWSKLPELAAQAQGDVLQVYADYWVAARAVETA